MYSCSVGQTLRSPKETTALASFAMGTYTISAILSIVLLPTRRLLLSEIRPITAPAMVMLPAAAPSIHFAQPPRNSGGRLALQSRPQTDSRPPIRVKPLTSRPPTFASRTRPKCRLKWPCCHVSLPCRQVTWPLLSFHGHLIWLDIIRPCPTNAIPTLPFHGTCIVTKCRKTIAERVCFGCP